MLQICYNDGYVALETATFPVTSTIFHSLNLTFYSENNILGSIKKTRRVPQKINNKKVILGEVYLTSLQFLNVCQELNVEVDPIVWYDKLSVLILIKKLGDLD